MGLRVGQGLGCRDDDELLTGQELLTRERGAERVGSEPHTGVRVGRHRMMRVVVNRPRLPRVY